MTYSSNTVLVVITCEILSTFGLTEALRKISIKAVRQKNSPYVSPELLHLYLSESMKSVIKVPGSLWNVRYCLKSFVDYVEVAVNGNGNTKRGYFLSRGYWSRNFHTRLDKTALFAVGKPQLKARPDFFDYTYLAFIKGNPKPWAWTITWGLSHKTRVNYLKITHISYKTPYFDTRCWYNCKKILSVKTYFTKINTLFVSL